MNDIKRNNQSSATKKEEKILQGKKILMVEDETSIAEPLQHMLEKKGCSVTWKKNGNEALLAADDGSFDMILLDRMIPGISGSAVFRQVRQYSTIPVIMLTALDSEDDKVEGIDLGVDDYITKPFSFKELIARMKAVFRRSQTQEKVSMHAQNFDNNSQDETRLIKSGSISIDPLERIVYVDNEIVELSPKEFDILELLVENSDRLVSREILIDRIWSNDPNAKGKTIDVHLKRLRDKLDKEKNQNKDKTKPKNSSKIQTVRGVGYRFNK